MDDETTAEYSESILEKVEAVNNDVEPTNMPGTSKVHHETDEEEFEFEGLKPMLMKIINFNAQFYQRCSWCWRALRRIEGHLRNISTFAVQSKCSKRTIQTELELMVCLLKKTIKIYIMCTYASVY